MESSVYENSFAAKTMQNQATLPANMLALQYETSGNPCPKYHSEIAALQYCTGSSNPAIQGIQNSSPLGKKINQYINDEKAPCNSYLQSVVDKINKDNSYLDFRIKVKNDEYYDVVTNSFIHTAKDRYGYSTSESSEESNIHSRKYKNDAERQRRQK